MWAPTFWPTYDYEQYGSYEKNYYFRQVCQPFPVYRVPPVYHPSKTVATERCRDKDDLDRAQRQSSRDILPLGGSFIQRRCPVSPGESARKDDGSRDDGFAGSGVEQGGLRRESTPDNTSSDQQDNVRSHCRVLTFQDPKGHCREMVFPKALDLDRPKRVRTTFTSYQLQRLEMDFKRNQYMVGKDRAQLASNLNLTETQVKVWFQNRRTKLKRDQCRVSEFMEKNAESIAACNILRLLQDQQPGKTTTAPSVRSITPKFNTILPVADIPSVAMSPIRNHLTSW